MSLKYVDEKWQFSAIPNIEESNFNKTLERFYDMGITGLTRENIQNSLDGKLLYSSDPVIVKIKTGSINENHIPGINEVKERISNLKGQNDYARETISHMKSKLNQDEVRYISFEDKNTRGLAGARNGQSGNPQDTWGIYAYNKGVHFKEQDNEVEESRGGSHGVGKIASNAASDLFTMYFANCDENGEQHLGGTVQLIEHMYKGQAYRSTGYFTDVEVMDNNKTKFYPFENHFHEIFQKKTRGLKIIIPYLREDYDDERSIIKSVCDSFFISITLGKLEVHVNGNRIAKDTIKDYVFDEYYYSQDISEIKKEFTPLYLNTYLKEPPKEIIVSNGEEEFKFNLYFKYDENISKGRVAIIRTIGMKIEDFKVKSNATKPFNAVLIGGNREDAYLKSLENESHTKLSKDHFSDRRLKKLATRFINKLSEEIAKVIQEAIDENNPIDGKMDTEEILYLDGEAFKKDLEGSMGTVKVSDGTSLVKSSGKHHKKEKRDKRNHKQEVINSKNKRTQKREPLKWQKTKDESIQEGKGRYSAHPDMVERVILKDKELIMFDFSSSDKINGAKTCDIALSIVDGMGQEYQNEFKINSSYQEVVDLNAGQRCKYTKNIIKDVEIKEGIAQLQFSLRNNFNRSLKFVYYVEV